MKKLDWATYLKVMGVSAFVALFGNWLSTVKSAGGDPSKIVTPLQAVPGMVLILVITVIGLAIWNLVNKFSEKNLPAIAYISLVAIIATIPGVPGAEFVSTSIGKIGLLPLCTPILSYAGISLGKDLDTFRKQGVGIVLVSLFAFIGTFIGSAVIAQIILTVTGQI